MPRTPTGPVSKGRNAQEARPHQDVGLPSCLRYPNMLYNNVLRVPAQSCYPCCEATTVGVFAWPGYLAQPFHGFRAPPDPWASYHVDRTHKLTLTSYGLAVLSYQRSAPDETLPHSHWF